MSMNRAGATELRRRMENSSLPLASGGLWSSLDAAIALFCESLPEYGFKLVVPPPLADGGRPDAAVSAWRRGESRAATYAAATPALALVRATLSEWDKREASRRLESCNRCCGVGWTIAGGGQRERCPHTQKAPLPASGDRER